MHVAITCDNSFCRTLLLFSRSKLPGFRSIPTKISCPVVHPGIGVTVLLLGDKVAQWSAHEQAVAATPASATQAF